jgi:hypothetical protein
MTTSQLRNSVNRSPLPRRSFNEGESLITYHYPATPKVAAATGGGSLITILRLRRGFLLIPLAFALA